MVASCPAGLLLLVLIENTFVDVLVIGDFGERRMLLRRRRARDEVGFMVYGWPDCTERPPPPARLSRGVARGCVAIAAMLSVCEGELEVEVGEISICVNLFI